MKPKIAFFSFTCCEGCQLQVLNLEDEILDLVGQVEITQFREAMDKVSDDYDIAFIEGSVSQESEIKRLKKIREKAKYLVALGACADLGCVNTLRNRMSRDAAHRLVYGKEAKGDPEFPVRPIDEVVKVDYRVHGCPIDKNEFLEVVSSLLIGKKPNIPDYPVCVECKLRENECLLLKGIWCLGPITRAGCAAIGPRYGNSCEGCRGFLPDANISSLFEELIERGYSPEEVRAKLEMFNYFQLEAKNGRRY
jgi:sulfhydrogenase subunit delta